MISRATSVYVIMLVVFGAGLWAILSFGSVLLRAPTDLAGKWELTDLSATETSPRSISIEQSGRYFRIIADGKALPFKLSSEISQENPTSPNRVKIALSGASTKLEFEGIPDVEQYRLTSTGGEFPAGVWRAVRVVPLYPKRTIDQPTSRPAATTAPHS